MATKTKAATNGAVSAPTIELRPLKLLTVDVPIVGITELITHKWSEKAKRLMLEKQMNPGARQKKEPKNPEQDYENATYFLADGSLGFPAPGFKSAIVGACRLFDGLPMTQAKVAIRVHGEGPEYLVKIEGERRMREDMVRLETGVADIRYRPGIFPWAATLTVTFNEALLSLDSLVNLIDGAGQGGVGEWRPSAPKSATGSFGMFQVKR